MMERRARKILGMGQSTVELALLMPIVAFLLYMTIQGFGVNHNASEKSIRQHAEELRLFHQNGRLVVDDVGTEVPLGALDYLIPAAPGINILQALGQQLLNSLANLGLNKLFDAIGLDGKTYLSGFARGAISTGTQNFIASGFKKLDLEDAALGGVAGAFQSDQATEDFQGQSWATGGTQELFGTGAQNAIVGWAQADGDWKGAITGAATGMLNSDTANNWFDAEKDVGTVNDLLKGAARGAIEGSVAGLVNGKLDLKSVAIAGGMGAFNTKTVANLIPGSDWKGDSRRSATFGAANAALGTFVRGGNLKEALYSASAGALFSGQSMHVLAGDSPYAAAGIGAAYGAGVAWIEGKDGVQVAMGAAQNMVIGAASAEFQKGLNKVLGDKKAANNPGEALKNEEIEEQGTKASEERLKQAGHSVKVAIPETAGAANPQMPMRTDVVKKGQQGMAQ